MCLSPWSGDSKLYKASISRFVNVENGSKKVLVHFEGFHKKNDEVVSVDLLQKRPVKSKSPEKKKSPIISQDEAQPSTSMFKPLSTTEAASWRYARFNS